MRIAEWMERARRRPGGTTGLLAVVLWSIWLAPTAFGEDAAGRETGPAKLVLRKGDRVAIVGDSITEQKRYSRFMEVYLLACVPELDLKVMQFGWSGETAGGFAGRMENDLMPWRPTVVTTCYGMNDGRYTQYTDEIGQAYERPMRQIVARVKQAGGTVLVGSPGVVDSDTFDRAGRRQHGPEVYNANLKQLAGIAGKTARQAGMPFADVHEAMMSAMQQAKAALGKEYHVAGGDGVHPADNGQLVMAYAFLKGMGLDGNVGTVTVDYAAGKAEATAGHKVLCAAQGAVELESTRYPFCFRGDGKSPDGTVSILPFVPFQQDLNRLSLVVRNLPGAKAKVQWGEQTREFPAARLAAGVNLAAEFLDNPFVPAFQELSDAVGRKQAFETQMIKGMITHLRAFAQPTQEDPELASLLDKVRARLLAMQEKHDQAVRALVRPVRHKITITPVE